MNVYTKRRKRKDEITYTFWTIKSKLRAVTTSSAVTDRLNEVAIVAHDVYKRASLFLRAYCLRAASFPPMTLSTVRHCINRVCSRDSRGKRPNDDSLGEDMRTFWKLHFSRVYPELLEGKGLSVLKQLLAQQMLSCILTDVKSHFKSRLARLVHLLLKRSDNGEHSDAQDKSVGPGRWTRGERTKAHLIATRVFADRWDEVPSDIVGVLKGVLPPDAKKNVAYDLVRDPSRYVESTLRISRLMGDTGSLVCFMPTRRSNLPCHCKIDTEAAAQIFLSYSERVRERKAVEDRKTYNDVVWSKVLHLDRVNRKLRNAGFRFHHEISTDGVVVSLLYSREACRPAEEGPPPKRLRTTGYDDDDGKDEEGGRKIGLDPGKRNIVTMVCERNERLRYTTAQRNFESSLLRYRQSLLKEKRAQGVEAVETKLSKLSHKTSDPVLYLDYLKTKADADVSTREFYLQKKWRGWKFRIFCRRKSSEERMLNRVEKTFGRDCIIFYGNWSRREQLKGCDPSPVVGMKKLMSKRFRVVEVDEYKTSVTCNVCLERLSKYRKRDGKLSYSRLCCTNCGLEDKRSKRFVDRDYNAARNILWVGKSSEGPACLARSEVTHGNKPPVGAGGTSNDPTSILCL